MLTRVFRVHTSMYCVYTCTHTCTWTALVLPALLLVHLGPASAPAPSSSTMLRPWYGSGLPLMTARPRSHPRPGPGTWASPAWRPGPSWLAQASGKQLPKQPEPSLLWQALGSQAEASCKASGQKWRTGDRSAVVPSLGALDGDRAWGAGL